MGLWFVFTACVFCYSGCCFLQLKVSAVGYACCVYCRSLLVVVSAVSLFCFLFIFVVFFLLVGSCAAIADQSLFTTKNKTKKKNKKRKKKKTNETKQRKKGYVSNNRELKSSTTIKHTKQSKAKSNKRCTNPELLLKRIAKQAVSRTKHSQIDIVRHSQTSITRNNLLR